MIDGARAAGLAALDLIGPQQVTICQLLKWNVPEEFEQRNDIFPVIAGGSLVEERLAGFQPCLPGFPQRHLPKLPAVIYLLQSDRLQLPDYLICDRGINAHGQPPRPSPAVF